MMFHKPVSTVTPGRSLVAAGAWQPGKNELATLRYDSAVVGQASLDVINSSSPEIIFCGTRLVSETLFLILNLSSSLENHFHTQRGNGRVYLDMRTS